jgi:sulfate adenylyltransferase subunit 1
VHYKLNINTMERNEEDTEISMNDIGKIKIKTTSPLAFDSYRRNRSTGSLILIDEATHVTVGAGMIV